VPHIDITLPEITEIMRLTATSPTPQPAFEAVDALARRLFDHNLLTVLRYDEARVEVERLYSSNAEAYPVGGRKAKRGTPWGEIVLDRQEIWIGHGPEDIKWAFADHELISSLGITGMMNVPIVLLGRCLGTLNISHPTDRFSPADHPHARLLAGLLAPVLSATERA
jgi:GAF domain-containing protein